MDAQSRFQKLIDRWLRFAGLCIGHDILGRESTRNKHTILSTLIACSLSILLLYTMYFMEKKLALQAVCFLGLVAKVC